MGHRGERSPSWADQGRLQGGGGFEVSLKGLGGVCQVGVGERAFQAKDSRAKASEAGCGLEHGRGSGKGAVQRGPRIGWGCSGRRDGERPGHQGPQVGRLRGLD